MEPDERKWPVYNTESPVGLMSPDYTSEKIGQVELPRFGGVFRAWISSAWYLLLLSETIPR